MLLRLIDTKQIDNKVIFKEPRPTEWNEWIAQKVFSFSIRPLRGNFIDILFYCDFQNCDSRLAKGPEEFQYLILTINLQTNSWQVMMILYPSFFVEIL